jgi:hypothetical protein
MAKYHFVIRYLRRDTHVNQRPDSKGDLVSLSHQELGELLAVDMPVGLVQFGALRVVPDEAKGARVGAAAAANAKELGAPPGATIWCDCEWITKPTWEQQESYIEAWASEVGGAGYSPEIYYTPDIDPGARDSAERAEIIYRLKGIKGYWQGGSIVGGVASRGYSMIQGLPTELDGLIFDQDMARLDAFGGRPSLIAP